MSFDSHFWSGIDDSPSRLSCATSRFDSLIRILTMNDHVIAINTSKSPVSETSGTTRIVWQRRWATPTAWVFSAPKEKTSKRNIQAQPMTKCYTVS